MTLTRRDAIARALAALGAALLARTATGAPPSGVPSFAAARATDALRRVAESCRAAGVDSAELIVACEDREGEELAAFLNARVRADFVEDRVIAIGGWLLARTEAALLAALR